MIVDLRRYTLRPGQLGPYLRRYGEAGYPAQCRHLGEALGWFVTDVGPQNQVVHLWEYDSLADMERQRAEMASDPIWVEVRQDFKGIFAAQETRVMAQIEALPYRRARATPGLVDIRIYTLQHGQMPEFISYLRDEAAEVQARHWSDNIVYLSGVIGGLSQVVHIWGHSDHAQRLERRETLLSDPDWQNCLKAILPKVQHMETMTAVPAPFWTRPDR